MSSRGPRPRPVPFPGDWRLLGACAVFMFIASVINVDSPDQHRIGAAVGMVCIAVGCAFGAGYALRDLQAHGAQQADHHSD